MRVASVFGRILSLLLVFILGFMTCVGALFLGGYLAYSKVTLDRLGVNTDDVFSKDAEVDLTAMSIAQLIEEFSSLPSDLSLNLLEKRYGLLIHEDVDRFLTDEVREKPLSELFSKEAIEDMFSELYFGECFGYEQRKNPDYDPENPAAEPEMIWIDPNTNERIIGINSVVADITLGEVLDGGIPTDKIMEDLTVGEMMELEAKDHLPVYIDAGDGTLIPVNDIDPIVIWYDRDGEEVASVVGALANKSVDDLTTGLDDLLLGHVLGTVEYQEKTYTYEVKSTDHEFIVLTEAESVISEIADLSLDELSDEELNDRIQNMVVADLLDYEKDPVTGKWLDSEGIEVNSIVGQIASSTVGSINETIDGLTFGEISELVAVDDSGNVIENPGTYEGTVTWYEKGYEKGAADNEIATGLNAAFADLTVAQMSDEEAISDAIQQSTVADVMEYTKTPDGDYVDRNGDPVGGFMAVIADKQVSNIQQTLDEAPIGEFMGYELDTVDGKWKKDGVAVDALMQKVCSKTMDGLDGLHNELELQDVIEDRDGVFLLVDPDTKVNDLNQTLMDMFTDQNGKTVSMGKLKEVGLITTELTTETSAMSFAEFVSESDRAMKKLKELGIDY